MTMQVSTITNNNTETRQGRNRNYFNKSTHTGLGHMETINQYTPVQLQAFYEIMQECHAANDIKSINHLIQNKLRKLMPHSMTAYGIGELNNRKVIESVNLGFPDDYIKQVVDKNNLLASPVARQWTESLEPVLITRDTIPKTWPLAWQQLFMGHQINNIVAHGLVDTNGKLTSYFTFANFDQQPGEQELHLVSLLVPHLHVAISNALQVDKTQTANDILSKRETEILNWVYAGKTNTEIGELLSISAFTVKNHIKNILDKLGAANRTHAVAKAVSLGIIDV